MPERDLTPTGTAVEEHRAPLGDVELTYQLSGPVDAPRVLYVSGSGSDLRRKPNASSSPLGDAFRLLAYDHRGLGRSTQGAEPPTMADFATDAIALLDHVGWDTCAAVGVSFGGMVLMDAAARAPHRFSRLVLACTSPGGAGGASHPLHELVDMDPDARRERYLDILDERNTTDPERRELVRSVIEAMDADKEQAYSAGEVAQLTARADHDCWDRLAALTMPVLLAAGRHDRIAPPENQEAMVGRLPDATVAWFDGGHAFFIEDRAAYPAMIDFLSGGVS